MSAPWVPSPLDYVGTRRFSLYPAIRSAGPNEWFVLNCRWSEVQIVNTQSGQRIWLPRQYLCGVSLGREPEIVVELTKELCLNQGALSPAIKKVIEMPRPPRVAGKKLRKRRRGGRATVVNIQIQSEDPPYVRVLARCGLAIMALLLAVGITAALADRF